MSGKRGSLEERLNRRLMRMPNGCLEWTGRRLRGAHGVIRGATQNEYTHRVAWELANGPIPEGVIVCHHCDNPPCCEPTHLFLGTDADNVADMISKGRAWFQDPGHWQTHCKRGHVLPPPDPQKRRHHRKCLRCDWLRRHLASDPAPSRDLQSRRAIIVAMAQLGYRQTEIGQTLGMDSSVVCRFLGSLPFKVDDYALGLSIRRVS